MEQDIRTELLKRLFEVNKKLGLFAGHPASIQNWPRIRKGAEKMIISNNKIIRSSGWWIACNIILVVGLISWMFYSKEKTFGLLFPGIWLYNGIDNFYTAVLNKARAEEALFLINTIIGLQENKISAVAS